MRHYYDHCPFTLEEQERRLGPARILSEAGIPCLIYAEDELAFIHFVPTMQFALHVVVAEEHKERASDVIMRVLPYQLYTGNDSSLHEFFAANPACPRVHLNSIHLELTAKAPNPADTPNPEIVIIHPQSHFNLDVSDYSRSVSLPPFPDDIRFPTRAAFLDSLLDTYLEPNSGRINTVGARFLRIWIDYLIEYTFRKETVVLPNGDLEPEHSELKKSLKPENQPLFDGIAREGVTRFNAIKAVEMRKEVFRQLGRFDLANRPRPTPPPGNPALRARLQAGIQAKRNATMSNPISRPDAA